MIGGACHRSPRPVGREPRRRPGFALFALLAAPLCIGVAATAHADNASYVVEREVEIGAGYLSDDAFRYGKYTGLTDQGLIALIDLRLSARPVWDSGETLYGELAARQFSYDSHLIEAELGARGRQRVRASFQSIPRYRSGDTVTPFRHQGASFFALPPTWQAEGNTTAGMTRLEESLRESPLRERRRRLTLDYERVLTREWRFSAAYRHDMRSGRRALGAAVGNTGGNARAALLTAPLDWRSDIIDLGVSRHAQGHSLAFAYSGSFFRNDEPALTWQNPFGSHPQWAEGVGFPDGLGRLAREPDNNFHQLSVAGSLRLTPTSRAALSVHHGRMRQNEPFLPYTVNPRLTVEAPLPRESLDARIDTTRVNLDLTTRPLPALQLQARYRLDERDNRTPRDAFRIVSGDAQPQGAAEQARINRPYGLSEHRLGGTASYRLNGGLRLHAGYDYTHTDRDFSEVSRTEEHAYQAGVRYIGLPFASFSADYVHQRRDVGEYVGNRPLIETHMPGTIDDDDFENHPLLRKYALADRNRDRVQLRADLYPDPRYNLGAAFAYNRDDFRNSVFGLNRADMRSISFDAGYAPREDLQLTAFYTLERYTSDQTGRQFNNTLEQALDPNRDWWVDSRDRFATLGASLDLRGAEQHIPWLAQAGVTGPVDLGIEVLYSRSRASIGVDSGPALDTAPLPDLYSRLGRYRLYAGYRLSERSALRAAWTHERYTSRDFALDATDPDTMTGVIALGERSPRYSLNWVTLSFFRSF